MDENKFERKCIDTQSKIINLLLKDHFSLRDICGILEGAKFYINMRYWKIIEEKVKMEEDGR